MYIVTCKKKALTSDDSEEYLFVTVCGFLRIVFAVYA